ncbi:MAG: hypothetical protein A2293_14315 [Elusimicrobia bacterium RIFOXYB2_FULL_49_7]|nr:MAG: hypothetical protein A2293_14315 [Elusimicrobia bacterium RIFOXYB2_FULL_49_7]
MYKLTFLSLCFCLVAVSCQKKGVQLEFQYHPGKKIRYHVVSEINTRTSTNDVINRHNVKLDAVALYTIDSVLANGDAKLVLSYDKISYLNTQNTDKTEEILAYLKTHPLQMTLSPFGEIVSASGFENIPERYLADFNILTLLFKAHPIFPRQPVEIGRKWDRQQEYPIENGLIKGNMLVYKRFFIQDTGSKNGFPSARIVSEINMKFSLPDDARFELQQEGKERLGLFGTGSIIFDREQREVESTHASLFGKMIVSMTHPISGTPIKTRIEMAQNIAITRIQ